MVVQRRRNANPATKSANKELESMILQKDDLRSASGASQCGAGGHPERALTPIPVRVREENEMHLMIDY